MIEWLLAPIDVTRAHALADHVAWHGRLMVLAWAVLFPVGVLVARFFKITRRQRWPEELDNRAWWFGHLALQIGGGVVALVALALILWPGTVSSQHLTHTIAGWSVVLMACFQFLGGMFRGSKGGPTALAADGSTDGDHYLMTSWRRAFEALHKSIGYGALAISIVAVLSGLWMTNAPRWMWLMLAMWWMALFGYAVRLQRQGRAVDTYQAIWGPDDRHPGNRMKPAGWGARRPGNTLPPKI